MDDQKNQIVESLKKANNVLVTVSRNPSVDQLAGAIGLTLLLNKLGKHASAVYSGQTPSTIEFLQPEKTLEKTTDSLRDFIISLDKSKADKLRYKVEDQMVKIFITPYRTSISDQDLEFSQGDFNVDVVMALGVNEQSDLDQAIMNHGRILHDATVVSVNTQPGSNIGSVNFIDNRSSLCEILVDLGLSVQGDVLDEQIATAFLTGIVAETDRFSNEKTSSETMQISAKLMSAGANQQLVATQLQVAPQPAASIQALDGSEPAAELPPVDDGNGALQIDHPAAPEAEQPAADQQPSSEIHIDEAGQMGPPPTDAPDVEQGSRIMLDPPSIGGRLTANSEPESLDPSLDPLGNAVPSMPLLSHTPDASAEPAVPDQAQPQTPPTAQDVLNASAAANNPVVPLPEPPQPPPIETPPAETPPAPPADPGINEARDAVMNAVNSVAPPVLEPIQALNAQPMDLNLGDMPAVATSPESAFADPNLMPPSENNVTSDPGIPPGVLPDPIPAPAPVAPEPTVVNPTAPPPVPPPMLPPQDPSAPPSAMAL